MGSSAKMANRHARRKAAGHVVSNADRLWREAAPEDCFNLFCTIYVERPLAPDIAVQGFLTFP